MMDYVFKVDNILIVGQTIWIRDVINDIKAILYAFLSDGGIILSVSIESCKGRERDTFR